MATIKNGVVFINSAGAFAREMVSTGFGRVNQPMTIGLSMDISEATVFPNVATATRTHPTLRSWQHLEAVEERVVKIQKWSEKDA